ncbi:hypothetical protein Bca52824_052194 [Brassica carinata]|uniref:Uncharacterized protein n=1 Tax=Brassica carinata TaxID=52824 RepID=A0A8X7R9E2_BRACI|nr:hypothetical protein Bca52824_052194 [Brassica carinata]
MKRVRDSRNHLSLAILIGSEMEEELRDKKVQKDYYNMVDFVANAQQGIPKLCPCGSITKETVDEEDTDSALGMLTDLIDDKS